MIAASIADGDSLIGGYMPAPYLNGTDSSDIMIGTNNMSLVPYWGVYNGTTFVPDGLAISLRPDSALTALPDGIYTSNKAPSNFLTWSPLLHFLSKLV